MAPTYEIISETAEQGNIITYAVKPPIPLHLFGDVVGRIDQELLDPETTKQEFRITPSTNTDTLECDRNRHRIAIDPKDRSTITLTFPLRHSGHSPRKEEREIFRQAAKNAMQSIGSSS